jgi:thiosulfate/3-mercaptopyruvate sulfurtransferase
MQPFCTLVDARTLAEHLDDPRWLIFDCRHSLADFSAGRKAYNEAHIPGAFFADVERDLAGVKTGRNGRHPLPDPEVFAAFLRRHGANDETQIVAYDAGGDMFAARLWFLTRWIGHDAVAVLDGGFGVWRAEGLPVSNETPPPRAAGTLAVRLRPECVLLADELLANLDAPDLRLIDARQPERFAGIVEPLDPVAGHIPGACNRWFKDNFERDGRFKSPERLREEFAAIARCDPKQIVHQCGSGVSAAVNMLAMEHAGLTGSRIYPGGWSEWCSDPARPVEKGGA